MVQNKMRTLVPVVLAICAIEPMAASVATAQTARQEISEAAKKALAESAPTPEPASGSDLDRVYPLTGSPESAQTLVRNVFSLIGSLQHIKDLTRENIERRTGVVFYSLEDSHVILPKSEAQSDYFWNERLTADWWFIGLSLDNGSETTRPEMVLSFINIKNTESDMRTVCSDIFQFIPSLTSTYGYRGKIIGADASHVRHLIYTRPEIADSPIVEVRPAYQYPDSPDEGKVCIGHVVVR